MKKKILVVLAILVVGLLLVGCRQSDRVSYNLSQEADNFNVARKLIVINQRTDTILFSMTGNFSLKNDGNDELSVIGENDDGTYYKHFIYLSDEISYIVEDLGETRTSRYKYQINFNPKMIVPIEIETID